MKKKMVVLCAYPIVTEGLGAIFRQSSHFVLADVATSAEQALHLVRHHAAAVLLADPCLLPPEGMADRLEGLAIVALVCHYVEQATLAAYDGVVELSAQPRQMDEVLMCAVGRHDDASSSAASTPSYELSQREREVLVLVAQGLQNKEIADRLCISIHTVMSHRKNIVAKTGIRSVAGLTVYAMVNKLI